jgi:hypothetical protein
LEDGQLRLLVRCQVTAAGAAKLLDGLPVALRQAQQHGLHLVVGGPFRLGGGEGPGLHVSQLAAQTLLLDLQRLALALDLVVAQLGQQEAEGVPPLGLPRPHGVLQVVPDALVQDHAALLVWIIRAAVSAGVAGDV